MVIDASVWVAAFHARDAHHPEAAAFLRKLAEDGALVSAPLLALSEVAGAIARQTGAPAIADKAIAFFRAQPWIQLAPLNDALAAASVAAQQRLRGADAVYVALAAQEDGLLITLDHEMLQRAPGTVTAITPAEWLKRARQTAEPPGTNPVAQGDP